MYSLINFLFRILLPSISFASRGSPMERGREEFLIVFAANKTKMPRRNRTSSVFLSEEKAEPGKIWSPDPSKLTWAYPSCCSPAVLPDCCPAGLKNFLRVGTVSLPAFYLSPVPAI
jgi:hypothetical protein